jgi:DNA-binding Lrp family transcriptional regulator
MAKAIQHTPSLASKQALLEAIQSEFRTNYQHHARYMNGATLELMVVAIGVEAGWDTPTDLARHLDMPQSNVRTRLRKLIAMGRVRRIATVYLRPDHWVFAHARGAGGGLNRAMPWRRKRAGVGGKR